MPKDTTHTNDAAGLVALWKTTLHGPVPNTADMYRDPNMFRREDYVKSLMAPGHDPDRFA